MTLSSLIRKPGKVGLATVIPATPATPAIQQGMTWPAVARIATVAANLTVRQAATLKHADETCVRAWLAFIGETHQPIINEVLQAYASDWAALNYFLMRWEFEVRLLDPLYRSVEITA